MLLLKINYYYWFGMFQAEPTISTKASALLSLLPRRGPTAFRVFVEALIISGQKYLANLLDPIGTIAAQMEKSSLEEEETAPTEVSKETEEKGSNNEHESESKKEDSPEDQSTTTPEKSERVSYFEGTMIYVYRLYLVVMYMYSDSYNIINCHR